MTVSHQCRHTQTITKIHQQQSSCLSSQPSHKISETKKQNNNKNQKQNQTRKLCQSKVKIMDFKRCIKSNLTIVCLLMFLFVIHATCLFIVFDPFCFFFFLFFSMLTCWKHNCHEHFVKANTTGFRLFIEVS